MPRRKRKHANWPYRLAWLAILVATMAYVAIQTVVGGLNYGRRSGSIDWGPALVASCLDATIAAWFVAVGAAIGSFLNVVVFRLPLGRHIGGHSGCFYCQTPIRGADNVPVLAWLKLRGRCRTCRLPISIQYPLVELGVGLVFLFVYINEVSSAGENLPGAQMRIGGGGLLRMQFSSELLIRALTYLIGLCGLIAAALIAVRRQTVPLKLFAWSLAPWIVATLIRPDLIIQRWRTGSVDGWLGIRLDAMASVICGMAAAMALARLLAPILYPNFDRTLISSNRSTLQARQYFCGAALAGAIVGWQAVVALAWVSFMVALAAIVGLRRFRDVAELGDMLVWLWLGLLVFRANWSWLAQLQLAPATLPSAVPFVLASLLLAPLAMLVRRLASGRLELSSQNEQQPIMQEN